MGLIDKSISSKDKTKVFICRHRVCLLFVPDFMG